MYLGVQATMEGECNGSFALAIRRRSDGPQSLCRNTEEWKEKLCGEGDEEQSTKKLSTCFSCLGSGPKY